LLCFDSAESKRISALKNIVLSYPVLLALLRQPDCWFCAVMIETCIGTTVSMKFRLEQHLKKWCEKNNRKTNNGARAKEERKRERGQVFSFFEVSTKLFFRVLCL
jgi:hypothetical protein